MSSTSDRKIAWKRRYWWWLVVAILVVALAVWLWPSAAPSSSKTSGSFGRRGGFNLQSVVTVASATTGDVPIIFTALGTVIANQTVTVTSRVEGELQEVYFKEGQHVDKGQLLARIDPRPYQATLAQYQADLEQNQALLKSARQELERDQRLYEQKSLARQDLEAQVATVGQYTGAVKADQAQIQAARLNLDYTRITSPISGYTGLRLVDAGNLVQAGDSTGIVTVTQTDPIAVTFSLPQADLDAVLPGIRQGKDMPVWALAQLDGTELAKGALKFISNQIDIETGTIKLKALFDNPQQKLYPNQAVRVRLQTGVIKGAVLIPQRAVQLSDEGSYVWVVQSGKQISRPTDGQAASQHVNKRPVTTGISSGENVVIKQGLAAGDVVVTQGVDHLSDGSTVKIESTQGD